MASREQGEQQAAEWAAKSAANGKNVD